MSTEPEKVETSNPLPPIQDSYQALEDMFYIGYVNSKPYIIYKDGDKEIVVQYRTLVPHELRVIAEEVHKYTSPLGQLYTEQIEILARAIVRINNMPLVFNVADREDWIRRYAKHPTPIEMARVILLEKIKSEHILDALFDGYKEFSSEIQVHFEDIKKKLKNPTSSS
jgi:hypothetical protein